MKNSDFFLILKTISYKIIFVEKKIKNKYNFLLTFDSFVRKSIQNNANLSGFLFKNCNDSCELIKIPEDCPFSLCIHLHMYI